jgi:nicotinic acid mononucleotide adenylyltransferase
VTALQNHGIIVTSRKKYNDEVKMIAKEYPGVVFYLETKEDDVSSTHLRENMESGQSLEDLTHPAVISLLKKYGYLK